MVKHNNVVPNGHFHKDWENRVKTWFNQAGKKKSRRLTRKAKAAALAPRPVSGLLRPSVHCQTIKYASKIRAGRGFTLEELKEAGIARKTARSIGIAVDFRRTNKSVESLQANVQRLKAYKSKLVVFPRKRMSKGKSGDSSVEECSAVTQQSTKAMFPIVQLPNELVKAKITKDMTETSVYTALRLARADQRLVGPRQKMKEDKAKEKESKK